MAQLAAGVLFSDSIQDVQDPDRIMGGRFKEVTIECEPPQKVVVDGELMGTTPVVARVQPACLKVLVPLPKVGGEVAGAAAAGALEDGTGGAGVGAGGEGGRFGGVRGAASAAAEGAPAATTGVGLGASRAAGDSFEAIDKQH